MALSEAQIVRFSRQILLRDVGGKGQERLLAATVRVEGEGAAVRSAREYLEAGGTPSGDEFSLWISRRRIACGRSDGCALCLRGDASEPSDSVALGALAALIAQRLILGIDPAPAVAFEIEERTLELRAAPLGPCTHR